MSPRLFDTHAHLDDPRFDEDRPAVLARMEEAGVDLCVTVGANMATSRAAQGLATGRGGLYFAAGVHPHDAKDWREEDAAELAAMLSDPKGVALGEIGLDFHYDFSPREQQKIAFERQLYEAYRLGKPAILHVREAHGETLATLRAHRAALPAFVVHCYSGSWESAKEYLSLGGMLSFAGPVTFKNAEKPVEVARNIPLDRLLIETDSPYLAPVPVRGRRNEPAFVSHVAGAVAAIRGIPPEALCEAAWDNGVAFFKIPR